MSEIISVTLWITATLTWYNPELGGINCDHECQYFGNGLPVAEWYNKAVACPQEFPRGTTFVIEGSMWGHADGSYKCWDAGGAVTFKNDGSISLDILSREPLWKDTLLVEVILPDGEGEGVIQRLVAKVPTHGTGPSIDSPRRDVIDWQGHSLGFEKDYGDVVEQAGVRGQSERQSNGSWYSRRDLEYGGQGNKASHYLCCERADVSFPFKVHSKNSARRDDEYSW